mmetsp:Transcript_6132/g.14391  ORF Transcript_6132/g.14391 Transcript_6132/m.14391 type:complete len:110 (+) Transcript_6132:1-330(+)
MHIHQVDTCLNQCLILEQLHSEDVWRSETTSAVRSSQCSDGRVLRAVEFSPNLKDRSRAMHLALAAALALELPKDQLLWRLCRILAQRTSQVMPHFPVLETLVKQARDC